MIRLFEYQDADLFCHHSLDESPSPSEFYMHAHERMEILYFLSGDAQYLVEGSVYPLHPGELLIMNRAEAHKLQLLSAQPYERIVMHFSPSVLRGFDPDGLLLRVFAEKPLGRQNHYASPKFSALFSEFDAPGSPEHLRIHMLLILANVLYTLCSLSEAAASAADKPVSVSQQILQYVNLHLFEDISLSSVSRAFFLSASQLGRVSGRRLAPPSENTSVSSGFWPRASGLSRVAPQPTPAPPAAFRTTRPFSARIRQSLAARRRTTVAVRRTRSRENRTRVSSSNS